MKIIDITHPIYEGMPVYSGNPEVSFDTTESQSGQTYISKITFGTHTGTHIDASRHVGRDMSPVDEIDLSILIGKCKVIDLSTIVGSISRGDVNQIAESGDRILLKTANSNRQLEDQFSNFVSLSPGAATYLASIPIQLIGIDAPSIKAKGSKNNTPHTAFLNKNIPIIEALNLSQVDAGEYDLTCLPLKLRGLDGAPVRAILSGKD